MRIKGDSPTWTNTLICEFMSDWFVFNNDRTGNDPIQLNALSGGAKLYEVGRVLLTCL